MLSFEERLLGDPSTWDTVKDIGAAGLDWAGYLADTPGALLRGGVGNLIDLVTGEDKQQGWRASTRDLLEQRGGFAPNEDGIDTGDVLGFLGDVVIDPTALLGGVSLAKRLMGLSKTKAVKRGLDAVNATISNAANRGVDAVNSMFGPSGSMVLATEGRISPIGKNLQNARPDFSNIYASAVDPLAKRREALKKYGPDGGLQNSTGKRGGAAMQGSITRRYIEDTTNPLDPILDFGAGKLAGQTKLLRQKGFTNVTPWEFGTNFVEGLHDKDALSRRYKHVFAASVLNVQPNIKELLDVIKSIKQQVAPGGRAVFNYPNDPRYVLSSVNKNQLMSATEVAMHIEDIFGSAPRVVPNYGTKQTPLWEIFVP